MIRPSVKRRHGADGQSFSGRHRRCHVVASTWPVSGKIITPLRICAQQESEFAKNLGVPVWL
jgi:hypothetical protein